MRVLCCLLLLWFGAPVPSAVAADAELDFQRAVEAYRAGDYRSAETLWRGLLEPAEAGGSDASVIDRAAVLYTLGNTAGRQERPLEAAAWYTACIRVAPRHADAWANLEFVRAEASVEPADRGDLSSTVRRLLFSVTKAESEWLALGFTLLFALALGFQAVRGGALSRWLALGAGLLLLVGLAPWAAHLARGDARGLLVVSTGGGAVRSEPKPGATLVGQFAAGSEVRFVDALPGWVRAAGEDAEGWVAAEVVRPLDAPYRTVPGADL